jgi:hypothetical protein
MFSTDKRSQKFSIAKFESLFNSARRVKNINGK